MVARKPKADPYVQRILDTLHEHYLPQHPKARIDAYRYNSACIRIRVVDPIFAGMDICDRGEDAWDILQEHLPERVFCDISLFLFLTPKETKTSGANVEFESPTPTPGSVTRNGKATGKARRAFRR